MNFIFKFMLLTVLSMAVFAEDTGTKENNTSKEAIPEEAIDPSNSAKPMSFLSLGLTQFAKDQDGTGGPGGTGVNATAAVAGKLSKNGKYIIILEAQAKPDLNSLNYYRGRWFNVFDTGNEAIPALGYSIDYFGNDTMDSVSLGGLMQIYLGVPYLRLFWNVAYNYSDQTLKSPTGDSHEKVNGVYTNIFFNAILSSNMTYLMVIPEYQYNKSDNLESDGFRLSTMIGAPLTDNKQLWIAGGYIYQIGKMDYNIGNQPGMTNPYGNIENRNSYMNFNLTYYFR